MSSTEGMEMDEGLAEEQPNKEFLVIDDDDDNSETEKKTISEDEGDLENLDEEVEAMLEDGLPDKYKDKAKKPYQERHKLVIEEKGLNFFEIMPPDWIFTTHCSGIPVYLHKPTRVCTLSKPYFLGQGSLKTHEIPLSAIPCLQYKRALIEEENQLINDARSTNKRFPDDTIVEESPSKKHKLDVQAHNNNEHIVNKELYKKLLKIDDEIDREALAVFPSAKVETSEEKQKALNLKSEEVTEYCKKLFKFKKITIKRFTNWAERKKYRNATKLLQAPPMSNDVKLISFVQPAKDSKGEGAGLKKYLMNTKGKSYVCILHEYVQRALKRQPFYDIKLFENGSNPFVATVVINGMRYGTGHGSSKRAAKLAAAKMTVDVLIPELRGQIAENDLLEGISAKSSDKNLEFFDELDLKDPRIPDICNKTMEHAPFTVLQACLARNFELKDRQIQYEVKNMNPSKNELTMTVGKHSTTIKCRTKREGKQIAAQTILQALHPNITSYGSLLRLYGTQSSVKSYKMRKLEQRSITSLQSMAGPNRPNYSLLEKLRSDMLKLSEEDKKITPTKKITVDGGLPFNSSSDLESLDF